MALLDLVSPTLVADELKRRQDRLLDRRRKLALRLFENFKDQNAILVLVGQPDGSDGHKFYLQALTPKCKV
jgi:hypothetical protein